MSNTPILTDTSEIRLANGLLWVSKVTYDNGFESIGVAESKRESIEKAMRAETTAFSKRPEFMPEIGGTDKSNTNNAIRIVGDANFIRSFLPRYIHMHYDVHLFINRDNYKDACLMAFDRNIANVKPIYISSQDATSLTSLKNCLYYFVAFIIIKMNDLKPEPIQPTLYRWATNWVFKSTNVPLQTVLTRG